MLSFQLLSSLFVIALIVALISGLLFLAPVMPMKYTKLHLHILVIPVLFAVIGLSDVHGQHVLGPFKIDRLSQLLAGSVTALGSTIQKSSMRYLLGDHHYGHYFPLFTVITPFMSLVWMSEDLRLMAPCRGMILLCLILPMNVNRFQKMPRESAKLSSMTLSCGWLAFVGAIVSIYITTGEWRVPQHITHPTWSLLTNVLLVLAVMIPAARFLFHRRLIESVAASMPISVIMYAGIVSAGGAILARFAPIFDNGSVLSLSLIFSGISVLSGSDIGLIQVGCRRQLVDSIMSRVGLMPTQRALGVYSAAIIHLVLHSTFRVTLSLQSGSVVRRFNTSEQASVKDAYGRIITRHVLAVVVVFLFWISSDRSVYKMLSAFTLAWSLSVSWNQVIAFSKGRAARLVDMILIPIVTFIYIITHNYFYDVLQNIATYATTPPTISAIISVVILIFGSLLSVWVVRHRYSKTFAVLYV